MAQIIPSGYASVVIHLGGAMFTDGEALITLGVRNVTAGDMSDVAVAVADALDNTGIRPFLSEDCSIPLVEAYDATTTGAATTTIVGTRTTDGLPVNSCVLVEKRTTARGRRGAGRNFWPCLLAEQFVDEAGNIATTQFEDLQILFDEIWASFITENVEPVILQGDSGQSAPISPPPVITRFLVDPVISTQRRRMRR